MATAATSGTSARSTTLLDLFNSWTKEGSENGSAIGKNESERLAWHMGMSPVDFAAKYDTNSDGLIQNEEVDRLRADVEKLSPTGPPPGG